MLANEVSKYLAHKIRLAQVSAYYHRAEAQIAVRWAYDMYQYLKFHAREMSERDLALQLRNYQQHMKTLLPYEANKSFRSSSENLTKIINHCSELLQPKKQQVS